MSLATPPRPVTPTAVLHELLDIAARTGPEYGRGLASHLPMALQALHALGASEARLRQFLDRSLPRFNPPSPPVQPVLLPGWTALRGAFDAHRALAAHFLADLAERGPDGVLRSSLPSLLTGVGTAAFHGLIRTAHAAEAGHLGELASALAYWACRWSPLPRGGGGGAVRLDVEAWLARLQAAPTLPRPPGRLIADRIAQVVAASPAYLGLAGRLPGSTEVLARLSAMAVAGHGGSDNFTLLHLVTASRAMRVLSPWFEDPVDAIGLFADAFAAGWLASGFEPLADTARSAVLPWPQIIERAMAADDDHVIKLVHACRSEEAHYGASGYRESASLAVC